MRKTIPRSKKSCSGANIFASASNGYIGHGNFSYKYSPDGKFEKTLFVEGQGANEVVRYLTEPAAFNMKERYVSFNGKGGYVNYSFDGNFLEKKDDYINGNFKKIEAYFKDYCIYSIDHKVGADIGGNRLGSNLFYAENIKTGDIFCAYPNPGAKVMRGVLPLPNGGFEPSSKNLYASTKKYKWLLNTLYVLNSRNKARLNSFK